MMNPRQQTFCCPACQGLGAIIAASGVVQRCDNCESYRNDEEAARAICRHAVRLVCTNCGYWEMSLTGRAIECPECAGILAPIGRRDMWPLK